MRDSGEVGRLRALAVAGAMLLAALVLAVPLARAAEPPPLPASEIAQDVTLSEGAAAGVVHLKSKGGFDGDVVAVDLDGARIPGKAVVARVRIEFWGTDANGQALTADRGAAIAAAIEGQLSGLTGSDGTPFTIDVIPRVRGPGDPPTPGFHQIELKYVAPPARISSQVHQVPTGPSGVETGTWWASASTMTYAHETMHLLGFPDRYLGTQPDLLVDGKRYPLPKFTGDKSNNAQLEAWWDKVLKAEAALEAKLGKPGELVAGVPPGHENDILANTNNPNATLLQSDVDALIARAGVHLSALPGDLVANKDGSEQNLGVGAPLDLFAPRGGTAHADGLYAYCIDLHRHIPQRGKGYDVLGPASGLGASQMTALQKVLEEIGRRQTSSGLAPDGAQDAVWAVTDGVQPTPEARAILDAAGVAFDQQSFSQAPHYNDANAGGADTAAVTPAGVAAPVQADRSPPPGEPLGGEDPFATATGRLLAARVVAGRSRRKVGLRLAVDASQETVEVGLQRRGRGRVVPVTVLGVQGGIAEATLKFRRGLPKGRHRLVLQGTAGWTRKLPFTIGAKPKNGHKARR